jgi:hypothetical protein
MKVLRESDAGTPLTLHSMSHDPPKLNHPDT